MIAIWLKTLYDGFWFNKDFLDSLGKITDKSSITIDDNKALFDDKTTFLSWLENNWQKFSVKIIGFEFAYQGKLPNGKIQYVFMSEKFNFASWRIKHGYNPQTTKLPRMRKSLADNDDLFGEPSKKDLKEIEALIDSSASQEELVNNLVADKQRSRMAKGNDSLASTKTLIKKGKIKSPGRPRKRKTI